MLKKLHHYNSKICWTGNNGQGTHHYNSYKRNLVFSVHNKPGIEISADPAFLGDAEKYNPEELFLAALSSCHMLWYLHLCASNGIVVIQYEDDATGTMEEDEKGGRFTEVILHPRVTITDSNQTAAANALHEQANAFCFIANSCNFPVKHQPVCTYQ